MNSKYITKTQVVSVDGITGNPLTRQKGIVGCTITLNQAVLGMSEILPRSEADMVKVLHVTFISSVPAYSVIKKIFQV